MRLPPPSLADRRFADRLWRQVPLRRNQGFTLLPPGHRAPTLAASPWTLTVDITDIPEAQVWDEAVLMGRQAKTKFRSTSSPN
jgi:hypothetical protein